MILFKKNIKKEKKHDKINIKYPNHIKILDKNNFNDFINKYNYVIVDFWAPWCAPCKTMSTKLRRLSVLFKEKIAFGKINISQNQDISEEYKILSIPHIIFFKNGIKIFSIVGSKSIGEIKKDINGFLKK